MDHGWNIRQFWFQSFQRKRFEWEYDIDKKFVENALFTLESLRKLLQNIKTHESTVALTPIESKLTE